MRKILTSLALVGAHLAFSGSADAHTVSLGYVPGASLGEVTFWVGNYTHSGVPGSVPNEGSLQLSGVNGTVYGPTTTLFDMNTLVRPTGLADGDNYFYASGDVDQPGNLLVGNFASSYITACPACGPVTAWQGVTISGLFSGDYMFEFIEQPFPTQDWTQWNDSLNTTITLEAGDLGGGEMSRVPEPATLPLFGAGLAVMGFAGWRKRRAAGQSELANFAAGCADSRGLLP